MRESIAEGRGTINKLQSIVENVVVMPIDMSWVYQND